MFHIETNGDDGKIVQINEYNNDGFSVECLFNQEQNGKI